MVLDERTTVFDLLAYLCSLFTKEEERYCAIQWVSAEEKHVRKIIDTYKNFLAVILNASANEYRFEDAGISYINKELEKIQEENKVSIFWLIIEMEKRINMYSGLQNRGVIYCLEPLNRNIKETGIAIYPRITPLWNTDKSERNRERRLNTSFANYMMIRLEDVSPFEIVMHYWDDKGILQKLENGWKLRLGLAPVMDDAELRTEERELEVGYTVSVDGIVNRTTVTERVLRIFGAMFLEEYGIIVFPEALGTEEALSGIKCRMREHPEICTFVVAPTICNDGTNVLVVLGPGGIECLRQKKTAPAILITKDGKAERENLHFDNQVHLLITHELGLMAFPICAELLDPDYYRLILNTALVDTIICASFSPGVLAFRDTILKGTAARLLQMYVNTCSAKSVSRSGRITPPVGFVQLPCSDTEFQIVDMEWECMGKCPQGICYFDVTIIYNDKKFQIESFHRKCA
ncbi:MAG: hypothetical protein NC419_06225 [Muribaculaceae bacterium]|nr:hypothetical protein [Muribaculaceae bacterium]